MKESIIISAHENQVLEVAFTPDSQLLVSAGTDGIVKLWSVTDWGLIREFEGHGQSVNCISVSPEGLVLATGSSDTSVKLWNLQSGKLIRILQGHKQPVSSVKISPDGQLLASGSYDGTVKLWDLGSGEKFKTLASQRNVSAIAFTPDAQAIAVSGVGEEISLWSMPGGDTLGRLGGHKTAVTSLAFTYDGLNLISADYDGSIRIWSVVDWTLSCQMDLKSKGVFPIAVSRGDRIIAVASEYKVQLFSTKTCAPLEEMQVPCKSNYSVAFSPDGRWLALASADKNVRVWNLI